MRQKLKNKRRELGFTQKTLSKKLGISIQTYQYIEQGRSFPREKLMYKLLEVLKVNKEDSLEIFVNINQVDSLTVNKRGDVARNICTYMNSKSNKIFTIHHINAIRTGIQLEYKDRKNKKIIIKSYTDKGKLEIFNRIAEVVNEKYNLIVTAEDVKLYKNSCRDEYCNRTGKTTWGIPEVRKKLGYNPSNGYQKR